MTVNKNQQFAYDITTLFHRAQGSVEEVTNGKLGTIAEIRKDVVESAYNLFTRKNRLTDTPVAVTINNRGARLLPRVKLNFLGMLSTEIEEQNRANSCLSFSLNLFFNMEKLLKVDRPEHIKLKLPERYIIIGDDWHAEVIDLMTGECTYAGNKAAAMRNVAAYNESGEVRWKANAAMRMGEFAWHNSLKTLPSFIKAFSAHATDIEIDKL